MSRRERLIIAGSRGWDVTDAEIDAGLGFLGLDITDPGEVLCGMARGADLAGKRWAEAHGIPVSEYVAHWQTYGKAAGHVRNKEMAERAHSALIFWDGSSPGSANMAAQMLALGKPVAVLTRQRVAQRIAGVR